MKRRGFLKFLGMAAAAPVAASIQLSAEAEQVRVHNPIPDSAWETARNIRHEMNGATMSITFSPSPGWNTGNSEGVSYQEYSDAGRMPRYEGIVNASGVLNMWRFDVVAGHDTDFRCYQCGRIMPFNREDFREHGQTCNFIFGLQASGSES